MQWTDKAGALGPGNAYRAGGAGEESGTDGTASAADGRAKEMRNPTSHDQSFGDAAATDRERDAKGDHQDS